MKKQTKTCEFCSAEFIDNTPHNKIACDKPECREQYVEWLHGDKNATISCKYCLRIYHPDAFNKGVCFSGECLAKKKVYDHGVACERFWKAHDTAYEALNKSPLAKLLNEFGSENVDIAFHRYITAGIKHHNKTSTDGKTIDELIMWQPDKYLATQTSGRIWDIAATFSYFSRVVSESGVPWVKPLYTELAKGTPVEATPSEPIQLLLTI